MRGLSLFFSGFMVEQKQQNGSIAKGPEAIGNGMIVGERSGENGTKAGDEAFEGGARI
jgi:hypothetical protein